MTKPEISHAHYELVGGIRTMSTKPGELAAEFARSAEDHNPDAHRGFTEQLIDFGPERARRARINLVLEELDKQIDDNKIDLEEAAVAHLVKPQE